MIGSELLPRVMGGGAFCAEVKPVHFIYMDEAGISSKEPVLVVAGVVVHADKKWRRLHSLLNELAQECFPDGVPEKFVFHATDIFHGSGFFPRAKWSLSRRLEILRKLLRVPWGAGVAVACGYVRKNICPPPKNPDEIDAWYHALAFAHCAVAAEGYLKAEARRDEVATVVAEDTDLSRKGIKNMHRIISEPESATVKMGGLSGALPLKHIVDTTHFVAKDEAPLVQVADVFAFSISRLLSNRSHAEELDADLTTIAKVFIMNGPIVPAGYAMFRVRPQTFAL